MAAGCQRPAEEPRLGRSTDIPLVPDTVSAAGEVPRNATLETLLRDNQVQPDLVPAIVLLTGRVFDVRRLRAGQPYRLVRTAGGLVRQFEYEIDGDRYLRILGPTNRQPEDLTAELVPFEKQRAVVSIRGVIDEEASSLFAAMEVAGERPDLSVELADIFGGEIDFNSDLQPGDSFGLAFEKVFREGQFSGYGPILAAEFKNDGRQLTAIRFAVPGGKPGYYDAKGRSLRRFFLASPLKFTAPVRRGSRDRAFTRSSGSTGPISEWTTGRRRGLRSSRSRPGPSCRPGGAARRDGSSTCATRAATRPTTCTSRRSPWARSTRRAGGADRAGRVVRPLDGAAPRLSNPQGRATGEPAAGAPVDAPGRADSGRPPGAVPGGARPGIIPARPAGHLLAGGCRRRVGANSVFPAAAYCQTSFG